MTNSVNSRLEQRDHNNKNSSHPRHSLESGVRSVSALDKMRRSSGPSSAFSVGGGLEEVDRQQVRCEEPYHELIG